MKLISAIWESYNTNLEEKEQINNSNINDKNNKVCCYNGEELTSLRKFCINFKNR
jgi:hypothetical protein